MSFGEGYLRHPDLFPARPSGEAWGGGALTLSLAGEPYRLGGLGSAQEATLRERFRGFVREDRGAEATPVEVFRVAGGEFLPIDTRGWELRFDLDAAPAAVRLAGLGFLARIEWRPELSAALWVPEDAVAFPGAAENLLRVLVAYRMLERGGALVHSAGVKADGGAFVFLGPSGAGKSTVARLSLARGYAVLSDDMNALAPGDEGPVLAPVPFAGDRRTLADGPPLAVRALLRLAQSRGDRLETLSRAEALAGLVACAPYVNRDPHRAERLLRNLDALLDATPAFRLAFSLAGGFWPQLLAATGVPA